MNEKIEKHYFFAKDMSHAISLIKNKLGNDAVIFSETKTKDGIEVEAGFLKPQNIDIRFEQDIVVKEPEESKFCNIIERIKAKEKTKSTRSKKELTKDNTHQLLNTVQAEIENLKKLLKKETSSLKWSENSKQNNILSKIFQAMVEAGFDAKLVKSWIHKLGYVTDVCDAWDNVVRVLLSEISYCKVNSIDSGIHAFIGQTGVGKTTTIAKLATSNVLRNKKNVVLVTTDVFRVAATQQLQIYADILNLPLLVARNNSELNNVLHDYSDAELILIDTAGTNVNDIYFSDKLDLLKSNEHKIDRHLVVSANYQQSSLNSLFKLLDRKSLSSCILTKLDEVSSYGPALSTFINNDLSVSYFCDGQSVTDNLRSVDKKELIDILNQGIKLLHRATLDMDKIDV